MNSTGSYRGVHLDCQPPSGVQPTRLALRCSRFLDAVSTPVLNRGRVGVKSPSKKTGAGPRWIIATSRGISRSISGRDGRCLPLVFLDGLYLGDAWTVDIDRILPMVDLEAIEAYTSIASLPVEFNRPGSLCGVLVFWTR